MIRVFFFIILLLATPGYAVESPITYSRGNILITTATSPHLFDAEIRDAENAARSPGWFNYAVPEAKKAAMLTHARPVVARVSSADGFAAVDVLFVDKYGAIRQIAPNLVPAELAEPISSEAPMLAVIYLKAGTVAALNIQPNDSVSHAIFAKKPVVITEAAPVAPALAGSAPLPWKTETTTPPETKDLPETGDLMVASPPEPPTTASNRRPVNTAPPEPPVKFDGPTPQQEMDAARKREVLVERVLRQPVQEVMPKAAP